MKSIRIIIGVFFAIVAIAVVTLVCYYWHGRGCETESLLAAAAFYFAANAAIWYTIDSSLNHE